MAVKKDAKETTKPENRVYFIIAYVLSIITGIFVLLVKGNEDKRLQMHAFQAVFLGIIMIVVAVFFGVFFIGFIGGLLNLLIWLYGMYVGIEGYIGRDVVIPGITEYAKRYSGYAPK